MRPFYKNWGRSVIGVLAVMLLMLNFMSSALAQTGGGDERRVGVSCDGVMGALSGTINEAGHCHSDAQDCQSSSCHFYLGVSFSPLSVASGIDITFADSCDQWAVSPQATPYRPPIFVL